MITEMSRFVRSTMLLAAAALTLTVLSSCQKEAPKEDEQEEKTWKLSMIKYEELRQTEDAMKGFKEGLDAAGLRGFEHEFRKGLDSAGLQDGVDYIMVTRSAQGSNDALLAMIDATSVDGTDMIISLQTPTLHAAVKRGEGIPLVFMVVANPYVISTVGRSDNDHLPYLTGVYTNTTYETMLGNIKRVMPNAKTIGSLYTPAEMNAIYYIEELSMAAAKAGFKLIKEGVNYKSSVPLATQSLIDKDIDAIVQIEDNMTSAVFSSIIQVARENEIPVFSFVNEQAELGSVIVYAPDYVQGARTAADFAARIMRGENPQEIPLAQIEKFDHIVNLKAAREAGLTIPQDIIDAADVVLDDEVQ